MDSNTCQSGALRPQITDVYGFQVPTSIYYLHRGHTWAVPEESGLVRGGMDAFSQRILGPVDEVKLPVIGRTCYQDHVCLTLLRN